MLTATPVVWLVVPAVRQLKIQQAWGPWTRAPQIKNAVKPEAGQRRRRTSGRRQSHRSSVVVKATPDSQAFISWMLLVFCAEGVCLPWTQSLHNTCQRKGKFGTTLMNSEILLNSPKPWQQPHSNRDTTTRNLHFPAGPTSSCRFLPLQQGMPAN